MSDEDSREDLIKGQLRQVFGNYDIAQEFEGKKTKKENIRDIQFFKDRFKEAMPEYKGMSDSEKWFAVAEAGLRIMAGKSPNAITNIPEGLKGLGPELSKDAKERRAYDRQVDLSAAKYAVESVNTDETRAAALAKEGRVQKTFVVGKSFTDPIELKSVTSSDQIEVGQFVVRKSDNGEDKIFFKYELTYFDLYFCVGSTTTTKLD